MKRYLLCALCLIFAGCQSGGDGKAKAVVPESSIPVVENTKPPAPSTTGSDPVQPKTTDPTDVPKIKLPTPTKVGTDGWVALKGKPDEFGSRIDNALRNLTNAWADTQIVVTNPTIQGTNSGIARFKDPRHFYAEYQLPKDPTSMSIMRSDSDGVKIMESGKQLSPDATVSPSVKGFPGEFTRAVFLPVANGATPWRDLLRAWARGEGGYVLNVEERSFEVQGKQRRIYRVIAETKKGTPTRVEIRLDADHLVPVSIRVDQPTPKGPAGVIWSAGWKFNQPIDLSADGLDKSRPKLQ